MNERLPEPVAVRPPVFTILCAAVVGLGMIGVFLGAIGIGIFSLTSNSAIAVSPTPTALTVYESSLGVTVSVFGVTSGTQHTQPVQLPPRGLFDPAATQNVTLSVSRDSNVVWMTEFLSGTNKPSDFAWLDHAVVVSSTGEEFLDRDIRLFGVNNSYARNYGSLHNNRRRYSSRERLKLVAVVVPRVRNEGSFTLKLMGKQGEEHASFEVKDPNYPEGGYAILNAEPFPITAKDKELTVTLRSVTARKRTQSTNGRKREVISLQPQLSIEQDGERSKVWTDTRYTLWDALGNSYRIYDVDAALTESAWKLELRLYKALISGLSPKETHAMEPVAILAAGEVRKTALAHKVDGVEIKVNAFGGSGNTNMRDLDGLTGKVQYSGTVRAPNKKHEPYAIDVNATENGPNSVTIESKFPYMIFQAGLLTEDQIGPDFVVTDNQGRNVASHPVNAAGLRVVFFACEKDVEQLNISIAIRRPKKFAFQFAPINAPPSAFAAGEKYASDAQWKKAIQKFREGLAEYKIEHWNWYRAIALELQLGNIDGYKDLCSQVLELYGTTADPAIAERFVKVCMIHPDGPLSDPRLETMIALAAQELPNHQWTQLARGISEYRAARFANALELLDRAEGRPKSNGYKDATALAFSAMAHAKMADLNKAEASLSRARRLAQKFAKPGSQVFFGSFHDDILARLSISQAASVITAIQSSTSAAKNQKAAPSTDTGNKDEKRASDEKPSADGEVGAEQKPAGPKD